MEVRNFGALRYECSPRESLELETVFSRTDGIAYHGGYKRRSLALNGSV